MEQKDHKQSKHDWELEAPELAKLSDNIAKELEFQYRLPESLASVLIKQVKEFLTSHRIEVRAETVISTGKNIEDILNDVQHTDTTTATLQVATVISRLLDQYPSISNSEKANYTEKFRSLTSEYIQAVYEKYSIPDIRRKMLLMPESHFENGHYLHSSQYYFAKRYFQNAENCDKLALLLANKIKLRNLKNVTLVGLRSYSGMLLNKTKKLLGRSNRKIDYVIIEPMDNAEFTWEFIPDFENLNTNFLIVLPITCTCSTYIRVRKYLQRQIKDFLSIEFPKSKRRVHEDWLVRKDFINIFLIQDSRLKDVEGELTLNDKRLAEIVQKEGREATPTETALSRLYSDFNWEKISNETIYFGHDQFPENAYTANPIVKLYADLKLPEECISCFPPGDLKQEKNMFLTHDNFETPNLIQDFPDFGKKRPTDSLLEAHKLHLARKDMTFTRLFPSDGVKRPSHHYGHIKVNGSSYLNYIRGNTFFEHNREDILSFFNAVLKEILTDKNSLHINSIVFITAENRHNSTFLDEITDYKPGRSRELGAVDGWKHLGSRSGFHYQVHTLRFDPDSEFIDNFMSSYIDLIKNDNNLIIYYEEVFSAGKTFKLLSNFVKHYKNIDHEEKELQHGFDYVLSLIDRTPYHTKEEILKKLFSRKVDDSVNKRFIPYFQLNAPIIAAAHLGNPLGEQVQLLQQMVNDSHLDLLKKRIGSELRYKVATKLPEENILYPHDAGLRYFLFEDESGKVTRTVYDKYRDIFNGGKFELLKLYVTHITNAILSDNHKQGGKSQLETVADKGELVGYVVKQIVAHIESSQEAFFSATVNSPSNPVNTREQEVICDTVLKILSRHPFTYYTKIYESVFKYCLAKLEELRIQLTGNPGIPAFPQIRKLKFYIRRLIDLDSSYIISTEFVSLLQHLYEFRLENGHNRVSSLSRQLKEAISSDINIYLVAPLKELTKTLLEKDKSSYEQKKIQLAFYLSRLSSIGRLHHIAEQDILLISNFILQSSTEITDHTTDFNILVRNFLKLSERKSPVETIFFEDIVINNAIYKYNTISTLAGYFMYFFKESVFQNHYRAIRLEGLLNQDNHLPALITSTDSVELDEQLIKQFQDPYFRLTGAVKAENLYLLQRLKELHKAKYMLHLDKKQDLANEMITGEEDKLALEIRKLEEKWMDPLSADQIRQYYFETPKSDPIIINANKFLNNSRHRVKDPVNFSGIKTALANMLKASTILMNKDESRHHEDFIHNIHEVMKTIVSILQPGIEAPGIAIGSPESKLGYALCIKYSNRPRVSSESENMYIISSDKATSGAQISTHGLIYNLMNGLFAAVKKSGIKHKAEYSGKGFPIDEQSLLTGIRVNDNWVSFNEYYYGYSRQNSSEKRKIRKEAFNSLMEKDCKGIDGTSGLPLLARSDMALFFRLSELDEIKLQDGNCVLDGRAVLVITCSEAKDKKKLLEFMSNEKVRLLLLIRQELLSYLKSITSNNTFYQLMKSNELLNYQGTLKHGLEDYFVYQDKIIESKNFEKKNLIILKSINDAIKGQISAYDISKNTRSKPYTVSTIRERITHILESPLIGGKSVSASNYSIEFDKSNEIEMDSFIFEIIILELLINAKRHSPNVGAGIEIHCTKELFSIKNNKKATSVSDTQRHRQGLELCRRVCTSLPYELISDITSITFKVTIFKK